VYILIAVLILALIRFAFYKVIKEI